MEEEEDEEEENPNFWDAMDETTEENTEKRKGKDSFVYVYIYICNFFLKIFSLFLLFLAWKGEKRKGRNRKPKKKEWQKRD